MDSSGATARRIPIVEYMDAGAAFRGYLPARAELRTWVEMIWTVTGTPSVSNERVLPNGALELIINLGPPHVVHEAHGDTKFRRAWIAGLQQGPLDIGMTDSTSTLVGIRFRPGGARPILGGPPLTEVTDRVIEIEGAGSSDIHELRERMLEAADETSWLDLVESMLWRRLAMSKCLPDMRVVRALQMLGRGNVRIDEVSRRAGSSRKHLVDLFRLHVGVTPKMLTRILRFHRIIATGELLTRPWADLAYAYGYSDQAHLCREFKEFAGVSPTDYVRRRTIDPNHVELTSSTPRAAFPSA